MQLRALARQDVDTAVELFHGYSAFDNRGNLTKQLTDDDPARYALVAERAGTVIAAAALTRVPALHDVASVRVAVRADERERGIGTALAAALSERLGTGSRFRMITSALRDDQPAGRRFAERYGLAVTNHHVGWGIHAGSQVRGLDVPPSIHIRTASAGLESDLIVDCVIRCLPGFTVPFGGTQRVDLSSIRRLLPADAVVLVAEDATDRRPCGISAASIKDDGKLWQVMFTGVDVEYRRYGIGRALKSALLSAGLDGGVRRIISHNDATNEPINRINRVLGMTSVVGYWSLARTRTTSD